MHIYVVLLIPLAVLVKLVMCSEWSCLVLTVTCDRPTDKCNAEPSMTETEVQILSYRSTHDTVNKK